MDTAILQEDSLSNEFVTTRWLLACGVAAAPLFIGLNLIQVVTRQGYNFIHHPVSLLLLGDAGWVQFVNFVLTGILVIAYAYGVRRKLHPGHSGTWGALVIGLYGLGTVAAGIFPPDASFGFPPGAPEGVPAAMSMSGSVHGLGFAAVVVAVIAGSIILGRRFSLQKERTWAKYCYVTALCTPVLVVIGSVMGSNGNGGIPLFGVGLITSAWISLIALRLKAEELPGGRGK